MAKPFPALSDLSLFFYFFYTYRIRLMRPNTLIYDILSPVACHFKNLITNQLLNRELAYFHSCKPVKSCLSEDESGLFFCGEILLVTNLSNCQRYDAHNM